MSALEGFEGPPPDPNRLRVEREEDTHYVRLAGEFDEFLQQATDATLHGLPEKGSKDAVVIDMRLVTFVDSLGLRVLLKHEARSREWGFELAIIPPRGRAGKVFELTGVSKIFKVRLDPERSSDAAIAAERASAGLGTDEPDPAEWMTESG